jgi:hypothetical protein
MNGNQTNGNGTVNRVLWWVMGSRRLRTKTAPN